MSTYYSANAFTVPEGLTGGVVTNEDAATVAVDWRYPAGSTVPGRTGVILKGAVGDYKAEYSVANVASPENNLLDGTIEAATMLTQVTNTTNWPMAKRDLASTLLLRVVLPS